MARIARIVIPGAPHHITQRGNRRQEIFSEADDYALYRDLMAESCRRAGVEVWSYCLMPNHVHLAMVPSTEDGLARAVGETHRRYSAYINARLRVTGHLFQSRFNSVAMDEAHWMAAARYIAMNPVKAGLVAHPWDWPWSSSPAHILGKDDALVSVAPLLERVHSAQAYLELEVEPDYEQALTRGQRIGRPLMPRTVLEELERKTGHSILPRKRGRKPKQREEGGSS